MPKGEHLEILKRGPQAWNAWREQNPRIVPDLIGAVLRDAELAGVDLHGALLLKADFSNANLEGARLDRTILGSANLAGATLAGASFNKAELHKTVLEGADLSGANLDQALCFEADFRRAQLAMASLAKTVFKNSDLSEADLRGTTLSETDFSGADLSGANLNDTFAGGMLVSGARMVGTKLKRAVLSGVDFQEVNLSEADLAGADLAGANLERANLSGANLSGIDLGKAKLVETNLRNANLKGCTVFSVSPWELELKGAKQHDLRITDLGDPSVTVDGLELAQFIYLMLRSEDIRNVVEAMYSKVVLICGHFSGKRKKVVDAIREGVRLREYTPVSIDFEALATGELREAIPMLLQIARFVIVDLTGAAEIPKEFRATVAESPTVPVQLLLKVGAKQYKSHESIKRYAWVLPTHRYKDAGSLAASVLQKVIGPAESRAGGSSQL
jgi:uncharacterized protein YjbI with pentapeptide repeats